MTAHELIEILRKFDGSAVVMLHDSEGTDRDITGWVAEVKPDAVRIVLNREEFYA